MYILKNKLLWVILVLTSFVWQSCYRNDIQFGGDPANNYTRISYTDTVQVDLSTVLTDSFATNGATGLLFGKYHDPYLGVISTKPFFQMAIPSITLNNPLTEVYDSAAFIIHLNKYYYGDTSRPQTIHINELDENLESTYNSQLFNTSNFAVKPGDLGNRTMTISPANNDSIIIRINDTKGRELFDKLESGSPDVTDATQFLTYFKGVSISVNSNDTTAVYGINGSAGQQILRVYYHSTIPYLENKFIDFISQADVLAFNQILTDRTGTPLYSSSGIKVFPSSQTNNVSFTQYGAGVLLKMTFPSLKGIIKTDNIIKLKKAELIIRPQGYSFDRYKYKLPDGMFLLQTDGTNTLGAAVLDSANSGIQYNDPVIDDIYALNSYYQFNVTSYINTILTTAGADDHGFFLLQNTSATAPKIDRAVIGNALNGNYKTQLLLTLVIIDK